MRGNLGTLRRHGAGILFSVISAGLIGLALGLGLATFPGAARAAKPTPTAPIQLLSDSLESSRQEPLSGSALQRVMVVGFTAATSSAVQITVLMTTDTGGAHWGFSEPYLVLCHLTRDGQVIDPLGTAEIQLGTADTETSDFRRFGGASRTLQVASGQHSIELYCQPQNGSRLLIYRADLSVIVAAI